MEHSWHGLYGRRMGGNAHFRMKVRIYLTAPKQSPNFLHSHYGNTRLSPSSLLSAIAVFQPQEHPALTTTPELPPIVLPKRTIPESALRFRVRSYFASDTGQRYPNAHGVATMNFKVTVQVYLDDLGLSPAAEARLHALVSNRLGVESRELTLTTQRFPNRVDNKRYLTYLLEELLLEAKVADDPAALAEAAAAQAADDAAFAARKAAYFERVRREKAERARVKLERYRDDLESGLIGAAADRKE
ncbi:unnamed protein product [Phaeothamnion confervicola]